MKHDAAWRVKHQRKRVRVLAGRLRRQFRGDRVRELDRGRVREGPAPATDALRVGDCCGRIQDFIDVRIGPDGTLWGAFVDDCLGPGRQCRADPNEPLDTHREGAAGWFYGGPSLWDEADPNGPYK